MLEHQLPFQQASAPRSNYMLGRRCYRMQKDFVTIVTVESGANIPKHINKVWFVPACMRAESLQSCPTLWWPCGPEPTRLLCSVYGFVPRYWQKKIYFCSFDQMTFPWGTDPRSSNFIKQLVYSVTLRFIGLSCTLNGSFISNPWFCHIIPWSLEKYWLTES